MKSSLRKLFAGKNARIIFQKRRAELCAIGGLVHHYAAGVDDNSFTRAAPNGEVGGGIAGIIKTAFAEFCDQRLKFVPAAEIGFAIAAQNFVEKADVIGNRFRHLQIGRRGENDFSPGGFLFTEKFQERFVVGQGGRVNRDASGKLLFQERAAATSTTAGPEKAGMDFFAASRASDSQSRSVLMSVPSKSTTSGI